MPTEHLERWRLSREWAGTPELEWAYPIYAERITALSGEIAAYFYEPLGSFEKARAAVHLNSMLLPRRKPSTPNVSMGFEYFDSAYYAVDGRLPMPTSSDPYRGRHSVQTTDDGNVDELAFWGWSREWGDSGVGRVTREYFDAHVDSVMVHWSAVGGPSRAWLKCVSSSRNRDRPPADRWVQCWPVNNDFQQIPIDVDGRPHQVNRWEVISLETSRYVDVFEVRDDTHIVGRAHLYHDEGKSSLRELFVHPDRRRQGYGTLLDELALNRARDCGVDILELWLHEADSFSDGSTAFGTSRGYTWSGDTLRRPNIANIGRKATR
jgi:GNAT superfamily N-acetyltransferase